MRFLWSFKLGSSVQVVKDENDCGKGSSWQDPNHLFQKYDGVRNQTKRYQGGLDVLESEDSKHGLPNHDNGSNLGCKLLKTLRELDHAQILESSS